MRYLEKVGIELPDRAQVGSARREVMQQRIDQADDIRADGTADHVLNRELREPDVIRVELVLKGAQTLYMRPRPDVAEI